MDEITIKNYRRTNEEKANERNDNININDEDKDKDKHHKKLMAMPHTTESALRSHG